jgi:predicted phage terminase large subunit-like protein
MARRHLLDFVQYTFPRYKAAWFHKIIAATLEKVYERKILRLMINMPPQHGKTELVSKRFPAWVLGKNPETRFIGTAYNDNRASEVSRELQRVLTSNKYEDVFPFMKIGTSKKYKTTENFFEIVGANGSYRSAGVGSGLSGAPMDFGCIDDPIKNFEEAFSKTYREKLWNWYTNVFLVRDTHGNAPIVCTFTRWHKDDLCARMLKQDKRWVVLQFCAEMDYENPPEYDTRKEGQYLWEDNFTSEFYQQMKTGSAYTWESLYQQRPQAIGGDYIKSDWFLYVNENKLPDKINWVRFYDLAAKAKEMNDYTASCLIGKDEQNNLYIKHMTNFKKHWPDSKRFIVTQADVDKCPIGIESVGGFEHSYQDIKTLLIKKYPVYSMPVTKDKHVRAIRWIDKLMSGKLYLVNTNNNGWQRTFMEQCEAWNPLKNSQEDDMIDSVSGGYSMHFDKITPTIYTSEDLKDEEN